MSSITQISEAENMLGNPSTWNEHKGVTSKTRKIEVSLPAQLTSENFANKQLKFGWNHVNWKKVEEHVNHLQVRITKAIIQKKWNLVKRLSYLLTHSFYAKLLAVRNVIQNKGKRTAGIDGELWSTPEAKMKAVLRLTDRKYKAKPLKRVFIDKIGKNEKRSLGIPTMYDRAMQALYKLALDTYAEVTADKRSFGFRKYRNAQQANIDMFSLLCQNYSPQWILEGDIKGCFDNISHEWLISNIPMDKSVLKQFLKAGYIYERNLFPTEMGTPQGGIISPILANITLDGIEQLLEEKYHVKNGKYNHHVAAKSQVNFVRYADDFIVTARTKEIAEEVEKSIKDFLKYRGLELSKDKTIIIHIDNGFDFLGWNFRKYRRQLLIKPSKKSIHRIIKQINDVIRKGKTWTQELLIDKLNPVITGWSNYHQVAVAKRIFYNIDHIIWEMLWQWARRRHPNKSHKWIASRYWHTKGNNRWLFATESNQLKSMSDRKIIRTSPIKKDMNPYLNKDYWLEYKFKEGNKRLTGMYKKIWERQKGICPDCNQLININSDAESRPLHHIDGNHSNYKITNLVYKHAHCHRQGHALNSKITA